MDGEEFEERGVSLGVTHFGQYHSIVTGPEGMDVLNIYLDINTFALPVLPAPLNTVLPSVIALHPTLGNRLRRVVRIQFDTQTAYCTEIAFAMLRELESREQGYAESVQLYFKQFLIACCRQVLKNGIIPSLAAGKNRLEHIERARQFIDGHCAEPLTLSGLSALAGVTETYFCRAFKNHTGKSVFEYILDMRILRAMLALRSGDTKIAAIGYDSGFNDLAHFNRVFKKRVGKTPREYRNFG